MAIDDKTARTRRHRTQIYRRAASLAKHHIAAPGIGTRKGVAGCGTHNQVGEAVAIDVAGARYAPAALVVGTLAVNHKAVITTRQFT